MSLIDATTATGVLADGLYGEIEHLGAAAFAHGARVDGVLFTRGDLLFDATGEELGECMALCERDGRLHALVTVYSETARYSASSAIWKRTAAIEIWPVQALEPVFAWYALGENKVMVISQ